MVFPKVREVLAVSKQVTQTFDVGRFNLRQLSELEVRKQLHIKFLNRFAAMENGNDSEDIYKNWGGGGDQKEYQNLSFLDQRNQAKMQ
jgi:hypothetical protein